MTTEGRHSIIPAKAGIQIVIPAKAGIQTLFVFRGWTPAFAGVTEARA